MLSPPFQDVLQWASYLICGVAYIYLCHIIYILAVFAVKCLHKVFTQVYNGRLKVSPSSDRAILITGATSGIGLALSKHFNAQSYPIIACYYTDQEAGYGELVKLNQDRGGKSIFLVHVDVRSQESIRKSYEKVSEFLDQNRLKLHALINNAGIVQLYRAYWHRRKDIVALVETNLIGPMLMVRQFMPLLIKNPGSRIVNVSSFGGLVPLALNAVYCATKGGLAIFGNALAFDITKHNVKVVTVYVGQAGHHTSIADAAASGVDATFEEFSPEERALYEQDFRRHERGLKMIEQMAKNFQAGDFTALDNRAHSCIVRRLMDWGELAMGAVKRTIQLEDSCFMDSFDNAVNMRNPPAEMYGGNRIYAIFTGTFLDSISHNMVQRISRSSSNLIEGYFS